MQPTPVSNAIETIPTELRDHVSRWFVRLHAEQGDLQLADHEWQRVARLVACSEYAAATLLREWQWFSAALPTLDEIPGEDGLNSEVAAIAQSDDAEAAKKLVRTCRHRWMLQLLWREVGGAASLEETLRSLSLLADRLLDGATRFAHRAVESRFGQVTGDDGEPVSLVILGMGKLGGRELNFSSDIDLVFLYPAGAESNGRKCIGAQDYFTRVSHHILALLDEVTADGFAFRIDTRLRPFGDSGPPVTSFAAFESYLVRHGRDWERYAYVKARIVGQAPPATVADELQRDFIVPFVYRRYLDFGVFESLREMHGLITAEVEKREMADNIKLGPGGIREIEFIVQSLQLVRGGSHPELQDRQLLRVLPRLVGRRGLGERDDEALADAYRFLRRLENFIQAIRDRQTHDLPQDPVDRARLCLAMGYPDWPSLLRDLDGHRERVTRAFESIAFRDQGEEKSGPAKQLAELWETSASRDAWQVHLENHGFADAAAIAERLTAFGAAPATRHIGTVASQRLDMFIPRLLESIKACEEPAVALTRVLALVEKIVRRSAYLALLNENEGVLSRLVTLCEQSSYIADQVARYPVLLDELLDPSVRSSPLQLDELESELRERLQGCPPGDAEAQMSILGQFQRANLFRIAIADFLGSLPIMKVSDSLTWLAEAVLKVALEIVWQDLVDRHGVPGYIVDGERREAGFAIIAYGKLGGLEMSYGSDLDLVFLHDSRGTERSTRGQKPIDNTVFFSRLVRRLSHYLTAQTGSGMLYEVDTRLRPDGQSGVMVSSIEAFEHYQEDNAWTWEHQALLRARPVAGSDPIGSEFVRIRGETLSTRVRRDSLRDEVIDMRRRMRDKLDASSKKVFDLKQGRGGIGDIEFTVQYLVLQHAAEEESVYTWSDNIRQLEALRDAGFVDAAVSDRLQAIYKEYRQRVHHLALNDQKPHVPAADFQQQRAWVENLWRQTFDGL